MPSLDSGNARAQLFADATPCDHIVQFYVRDRRLFEVIGDFGIAGLVAGQPLLAITTPPHGEGLIRELRGRGLVIEALLERQQLLLLDARETLERVMVDGMPDRARFRAVLGAALDSALATHPGARLVRAYGEMVDLLWQDGLRDAALALEGLWNELARGHPFSLLCTYRTGSFARESDQAPFEQLCHHHTHVLPDETLVVTGEPFDLLKQISVLQQRAQSLERERGLRRSLEAKLRQGQQRPERGPSDDPPPARARASSLGPSGRRLLVVGTNADLTEVLAEILTLLGYTTRVAFDGRAALAVAAEFRPEAVLIDLPLATVDGHALSRGLRAVPGQEKPRLIAMTNRSRDQVGSSEGEFDHHLALPLDSRRLHETLDRLLSPPE